MQAPRSGRGGEDERAATYRGMPGGHVAAGGDDGKPRIGGVPQALAKGGVIVRGGRLAAAANAAGPGWRSSSGTRTATSYRLGRSFMPGTVSEVSDISGLC